MNADRAKPPDLDAIRARAEWLVNQWTAPAFGRTKFHDAAVTIAREDVPALLAELDRLREALGQIERADLRQMTYDGLGSYAAPPAEQAALMRGLARAALAHPDSPTVGCAP